MNLFSGINLLFACYNGYQWFSSGDTYCFFWMFINLFFVVLTWR